MEQCVLAAAIAPEPTTSKLNHAIDLPAPSSHPAPLPNSAPSWARNAAQHGSLVAVQDPHHPGAPAHTYAELHELILDAGAGLSDLGLAQGERVRACIAWAWHAGMRRWHVRSNQSGPPRPVDR